MSNKDDRKKRSGKFRGMEDDYPGFEKFRKNNKFYPGYPPDANKEAIQKIESQQFGTGHLVHDSKVLFDGDRSENTFKEFRPGVVGNPPTKSNHYLTGWFPCSTGSFKRNQPDTVFLDTDTDGIERKCYILLKYRQFFKYHTLVAKKFEISEQKKTELQNKMNNLDG